MPKYHVERVCVWCGGVFSTRKRGKATARYCSKSCQSSATNERLWGPNGTGQRRTKEPVEKVCEWCHAAFIVPPPRNPKRRFCTGSCAASWRMSRPERKEIARQAVKVAQESLRGKPRPDAAQRMRDNNPVRDPAVRAAIAAKRKGQPFPATRGGNGSLSRPQVLLAERLQAPTEYVVTVRSVRSLFPQWRLPNHYKIDIALPGCRLAIEVDGHSHKTILAQERDVRKDAVLRALGWRVVRVRNERVLTELDSVAAEIEALQV